MLNEIDLSRIDLNLLVLYEAVMAERHVGRAAQRLNLSPSAVSHGLGRLRAMLGDPLFLRTPRGMVPTDRALALEPAVAGVLAAIRQVVASAEPFDPATSTRRFRIGTGDAIFGMCGPALVSRLAVEAPRIGIVFLQILPTFRLAPDTQAWNRVIEMLDSREIDIAVVPSSDFPARFVVRTLGSLPLVAATRADHPLVRDPTLDTFCAGRHILVSLRGDPAGITDVALAALGRTRDVVLTVPSFMVALAMAAESDLITAVPERLVTVQGARLGLVASPLPIELTASDISVVATAAALQDAGVAWLAALLVELVAPAVAA